MSEDHSNSAPENAPKKENQSNIKPPDAWVSARILGKGVVLTLLLTFFAGASGHWNEWWVKLFIVVFLILFGIWFFEFLHHRKQLKKEHSGGASAFCVSVVLVVIVLAYGSHEPAKTSPTIIPATGIAKEEGNAVGHETDALRNSISREMELNKSMQADALVMKKLLHSEEPLRKFDADEKRDEKEASKSDVTPIHIFKIFQNGLNPEIKNVENLYNGVSVTWDLYFKSVNVITNGVCIVDFDVLDMKDKIGLYPWVMVSIQLKGNELLRTAKSGDKYAVSGIITQTTPVYIGLNGTSIKSL